MDVPVHDAVATADLPSAVVDDGAGHEALRAVVTDPLRHGLAEPLHRTLPDARLGSLRLLRSKFKPGRKLTGYYAVTVGDQPGSRPIAVTWADGEVSLLVSPADPAMPQLVRLAEPATAARLAEQLSGRSLPSHSPSLASLRYRPGQRHVLVAGYPAGPVFYVKTDRDRSGEHAVRVAAALKAPLARDRTAVGVVAPIGYSATEQAGLWWRAPGRSLAGMVAAGTADRAVEQAGHAVRVIHRVPPPGQPSVPPLGSGTVAAEATATVRAGEHIAALLPTVGSAYADVVATVVGEVDRLPGEPPLLVHGDLKAENLLVEGRRLTVLDLDRAGCADPALDLGKFLADLRWWSPSRAAADRLEVAFRAGYGSCDPARWARAELLAVLFQVKLAARRLPVHDARWPALVARHVGLAAGSLEAGRRR